MALRQQKLKKTDLIARQELLRSAQQVAIKAINEAFRKRSNTATSERISSSFGESYLSQIAAIDEQMKSMQQEILATVNSKNAGDELGMEIRKLRNEKHVLQNEQASRQDLKIRIDEIISFLNDLPCELTEYEEQYVRVLLEKITVYNEHFIVEFKSGIEIQIDE